MKKEVLLDHLNELVSIIHMNMNKIFSKWKNAFLLNQLNKMNSFHTQLQNIAIIR